MDFIFLGIGIILGFIISRIISKKKNKIYGYIDVDTNTGLCRVHISSDELGNQNTKHAMFTVNHGATLNVDDVDPRDEQPL